MRFLTIFRAATFVLLSFVACQTNKKQTESTEIAKELNEEAFEGDDVNDADFIVDAIAANFAEIKLAQLATNKSKDILIRDLAKTLEMDYAKLLHDLQDYASKKGIEEPIGETSDAFEDLNDLAQLDDKDFDKKWCDKLKGNHKKSIRKFESQMDKTEDVELQNLISATLPNLKNHLKMVEKEYERVGL